MLTLRQTMSSWSSGLLVLVGSTLPCLAGAWLQPEGRTQIIFSNASAQAHQRFSRQTPAMTTERFSKQETGISAERGLSESVALLANVRMQHVALTSLLDERHSIDGSAAVGLKTKLWSRDGWIVSAQAMFQLGTERRFPRQTGHMAAPAEGEVRFNLGNSFSVLDRSAFVDVQAAYRWRGGGMADELRMDATIGLRPVDHVLILLQAFNAVALVKGSPSAGGRYRQHKIQTSLVYDFSQRWSLQIGAFAAVAGQNTVKERGGLAAIWWKF
jgi:protein XagA